MTSEHRPLRSAKRDADRWFREQGLPTFVPLRRWFTDLPRRVAPLVVWVTVAGALLTGGLDASVDVAQEVSGEDETVLAVVVLFLLALALAITWIAFLLVRGLLRRLRPAIGTAVRARSSSAAWRHSSPAATPSTARRS